MFVSSAETLPGLNKSLFLLLLLLLVDRTCFISQREHRMGNWSSIINHAQQGPYKNDERSIFFGCILPMCLQASVVIVRFRKAPFPNIFSPHDNEKPAFSNSSGLKCVCENIRFRVRLA